VNQLLRCRIEGKHLVISIGRSMLAFAAEHCDDNPGYKVISKVKLAEDVVKELKEEREDGSTLVTDMLDKAVNAALENGSTAFGVNQNIRNP
jgi:hypothetical protein